MQGKVKKFCFIYTVQCYYFWHRHGMFLLARVLNAI